MPRLIQSLTGPQAGPHLAVSSTIPRGRLALLSALAALSLAAQATAQISGDYYFETLPFPEPSYAYDVNNDGQALVYVFLAAQETPAQTFLWDHGAITSIEFPGSTAQGITHGYAINNKGEVFGSYFLDGEPDKGFCRNNQGIYTSIEYPGALSSWVHGANNMGDIVGLYFTDGDPNIPSFAPRSYTRDKHGNFAPVVVPFPDALFGGVVNITLGVNDRGEISGHYFDGGFNFHGFVRDKDGAFTLVEDPNAPAGACTEVGRINNRGTLMGNIWVEDDMGNPCAVEGGSFVKSRKGPFEDVPFPPALNGGGLLGINDRGDLPGYSYPSGPGTGGQATIAWRL